MTLKNKVIDAATKICSTSSEHINNYIVSPIAGELQTYNFKKNGLGLWAISRQISTNQFKIYFNYTKDTKPQNTNYIDITSVVLTTGPAGIDNLKWADGGTGVAQDSGNGALNFDCEGHLTGLVLGTDYSLADCSFYQSDSYDLSATEFTGISSAQWFNADLAGNGPGMFAILQSKGGDNYIATLYAEGQDGSVGKVGTVSFLDVGFGIIDGTWDDGSEVVGGYQLLNNYKVSSSYLAKAQIQFDCTDNQQMAASMGSLLSSPKACTFYQKE